MKLLHIVCILCIGYSLPAQEIPREKNMEISIGTSILAYQSVFAFQTTPGIEVVLSGPVSGMLHWQVGGRIGVNPVLPEGFGRLILRQNIGAWSPEGGIEAGVSDRVYFDHGTKLLREAREAMLGNISPVYLGGHVAPLCFTIGKQWKLSVLEMQVATHFGKFGRTMRVQVGMIRIGKAF